MTAVISMRPDGQFHNKDLERLLVELTDRIKQKDVMCAKEAADYIGVSERQIYRIPDLPSHKIAGIGRVWLKDELIDFIRKH